MGELALLKRLIDFPGGSVELVQNPALGERFVASLLNSSLGLEVITQLAKNELGSLVDLVTEPTVAVNNLDIECNITACELLLANDIRMDIKYTYLRWCKKQGRSGERQHRTRGYPWGKPSSGTW